MIGHILFSDLAIVTSQGVVEALALAPLAVVPDRQRQDRLDFGPRGAAGLCRGRASDRGGLGASRVLSPVRLCAPDWRRNGCGRRMPAPRSWPWSWSLGT